MSSDSDENTTISMKRKNKESYACPLCQFESSDEKELQRHTNEHLDEQEQEKLRESSMEDDELGEDKPPAKRPRIGGLKSNVPFLEEDVIYEGHPVNFKRVILKGLVDTAQKNLYELQAGSVRYRWTRSCFTSWLKENVPEAKVYSKVTLNKRISAVVEESNKFVKTRKENSAIGMGKMKKNIDPKLHSQRKETFIEPSTKEEKEMAEMGSMFVHIKKEIEETPIKQKTKKVSPQVEAKAKQLNEMLERPDENAEEDDDHDETIAGKKKITRGTLTGLPYDMYEKSQEHRLKSVQTFYENRKKNDKEPTQHAKKEDLESAVMNLCKVTVERMNINQAANPQPAFATCMPYGYSYPGLMGASLPMGMAAAPMFPPTQHMGMPPANMIRPAMSFQPPSTPEHNNSAKSVAEGFSIENTLPLAPISGRGRSSSELAGASLTGEGGPSSERDPETAGNSQIEEKEPSSAGFAPPKRRASVIGITGQVFDQAPLAKPTPAGGRKSVISSVLQSSDRASADINSTAPQSTAGPVPMAYGVPYMRSRVSQAGQMVHSDMITAQAGATSPHMSAQMMPSQMMAPPLAQQQMIQQQIGQQYVGQPQMSQPHIGHPQMGQPQISKPQMGHQQIGHQQMASMMAQQQGYYPLAFQRSASPMMMSGPSHSPVPNVMEPRPSKNRGKKKSDIFDNVFNDDEDY